MIEAALILNTLLFFLIVAHLFRRGYLNIYSGLFIYFAFHFMGFIQRSIVVYLFDIRSEYVFMGYMPTEDVLLQTIFVSALGLVSFVFGYTAALKFTPIQPSFELPAVSASDRRALLLAFLALSPLILYSFLMAFTIRQFYGASVLDELGKLNMTSDPVTGGNVFTDTTAYVVFARNMALPFSACLILLGRGRWWSFVPLLLCGYVAIQIGERWTLVLSMLVALTMALYFKRRTNLAARHFVAIGIILLLFVAVGQNREVLVKFLLTGDLDLQFDLSRSSFGAHPDFANFEFLTYVIGKVPDVSGTFSYFTQYLGLFTQPIPRMFWPDKPIGSPIVLVNLHAYGRFASRTTSLIGDGWISLGYVGVVVTLSAVGAFYGWLYSRFCRAGISVYFFCSYFWMIALLVQWARDGGYKILDFYFFCLMPLILAHVINTVFLRGPQRTGRATAETP